MSEAKHTPGPWGCEGSHIYAPDGAIIAIVHNPGSTTSDYPLVANRSLIAAAPDLLEALRKANQFITNGIELGFIRMPDASTPDSAHQTPGIIEAAIAKAEGRS